MAGRLKDKEDMHHEIVPERVPYKLVNHKSNVYPKDPQYKQIFENSTFVGRENIKSAAGILLKLEGETVGIMFINYRRLHEFFDDAKQIIETLASSAAIAIKNQRWMTTLSDIESKIITTLDRQKLLTLIVKKAVQITGADVGDILRFDSTKEELFIETKYPHNFSLVNSDNSRLKLGEGITGWVAKNKKAVIVDDVNTDSRYRPYYKDIQSELCVPLLDQGNILGVLNVTSKTKKAFTQRDLARLEVLANQAVTAIQYVENKTQLLTAKKLAEQLPKSTPEQVLGILKEEGVSDLFSPGALQQTESMFEVFEELKLSQSQLFEDILDSFYLNNYFSLKDKAISGTSHKLIYDQFCETYDYLDIAPFNPDSSKFEVNDKKGMDDFKACWKKIYDNLARKDTELFSEKTRKLTDLFCTKLRFEILGNPESFDNFYGQMIKRYFGALSSKIPHKFPIIYVCKEKLAGRDIDKINELLNTLKCPANSFALIIAFKNDEHLRREIKKSAFRNDFIVLNDRDCWNILAAKDSVDRLYYYILKQIDLVKISPYTIAGPIEGEIFFGRAEEEKTLTQNISHNSYAVLANRKMGKTSLLNKVVSILKKDAEKLVFYCDLQSAHSYGTFYEQFYQELFRVCPDLKQKITITNETLPSYFRKIIERIQQFRNENIIVVFDEVDELLSRWVKLNIRWLRLKPLHGLKSILSLIAPTYLVTQLTATIVPVMVMVTWVCKIVPPQGSISLILTPSGIHFEVKKGSQT